jgi:predicted GTPase
MLSQICSGIPLRLVCGSEESELRRHLLESLEERTDRYLKDGNVNAEQARVIEFLKQRFMEELARPTHIAVIGKCGVGKTSTINALFGFNGKISHTRAATKQVHDYFYENDHGRLRISDLPGLGEDLDTEESYRGMYVEVLNSCEVALFVLRADSRDMMDVQRIFRDIIKPIIPGVARRVILGLNQVDLVYPGDWISGANLPSKEQERNIQLIAKERLRSLRKAYPVKQSQVVPYSATKRYRLEHLFHAMISCTAGEAWVLNAKKQIADWHALVDANYLPKEGNRE